jgi:nucleoid-associated protein YgaU
MRQRTLFLLGLSALVVGGCKNKNEGPAVYGEQPYTPSYTSLDQMEAAPVSEPVTTYEPPAAATVADTPDAPPLEPADSDSDELLVPIGGEVYTVQKGDTLHKLARRFYNDQSRWRDIWEANQARLSDPDKLQIGIKLIIP